MRVAGILVQTAVDILASISLVINFEISADEKLRRQLLDCETDGIRRAQNACIRAFDVGIANPSKRKALPLCCNQTTQPRQHNQSQTYAFSISLSTEATQTTLRAVWVYLIGRISEPGSNLAALHQSVDVALCLRLFGAVLGHDLSHDIVLALEHGQVLLRELAPLRTDFLEDNLACIGGGGGICRNRICGCVGHERVSNNIDERSLE
jgi:hypothetical protein